MVLNIYHRILEKQNKSITNILNYQGQSIDLSEGWYFFTLKELFQKFANIDLSKNLTAPEIITTAKSKGYNVDGVTTWEPLYTQIFINEIESKLPIDKPVVIFDYPTQMSTLCLLCPDSPGFSQRFEFYIGGMEIGNAYSESTDPKIIKENFEIDFLPTCAGIGLGVDRLAMLFADTINIEDVIYFPTSKMLKK